MRNWLMAIPLVLLAGCGETVVPQQDMNKITLAYISAKIYAQGSVNCSAEKVNERVFVGCRNNRLDGKSAPHVWMYENGTFYALNGPARTAQSQRLRDPALKLAPLPVPNDVDTAQLFELFSKK